MDKGIEALIARKGNAVTGSYYLAECGACGEMFTSERMTGGEAIADTGDYGDCYCPHCDTDDSEIIDCGAVNSAVVEAWNFQQKHIDALIAALEQSRLRGDEWKEKCSEAVEHGANRIAELQAAPSGMMQLSNELAEMKQTVSRLRSERDSMLRDRLNNMESRPLCVKSNDAMREAAPLCVKLPDSSSKAFWSGIGKTEQFHPETYKRWVKEAIERAGDIAGIQVEVK
ncbi:Eaa family phage protein [Buttiauxella brennerae ATCC 51605]|uniref:Eaa family phage protein n=1 Tax=Buttiauxella brennerae ATCC 51605 TaxID=1354251 RepID=A0A1B7IQP5_9ENTR|nr:hypothetical protein [Buttiauxella brennerae]OAT32041.1 Eaa family phage protein [Buttiauxella brennerae ATCC 51605]